MDVSTNSPAVESHAKRMETHTNFMDALNIISLMPNRRLTENINVRVINEKYALSAYRIGTYVRTDTLTDIDMT